MIFAKKLPFIYSDTFIIIAIIVMALLAIISFVLVPLFFFKKTPTRKTKLIIGVDHKVRLNDELNKFFESITIQNAVITFVPNKGIERVRVAIYYPSKIINNCLIYDLDFTEEKVRKVHFPDGIKYLNNLVIVDDNNRMLDEKPLYEVKRSRLWLFSIVSGVTLAICIFLIVLIFSTHLRKVDNSFVGYYFFAILGLALIPGVYFGSKALIKFQERRGK